MGCSSVCTCDTQRPTQQSLLAEMQLHAAKSGTRASLVYPMTHPKLDTTISF